MWKHLNPISDLRGVSMTFQMSAHERSSLSRIERIQLEFEFAFGDTFLFGLCLLTLSKFFFPFVPF